ncbi:MAG: UvrD-helicase domain-containing protein [Burkholderiaceae bacterium]|jgi:ATP-dependent exoDNAse (exonuclease V) beta subunit|nr:UvrD-helicase domain-containing protein [Burkholderiaceae bacterium]
MTESSRRLPADAAERAQALDPTRSFIVQAPAGSGKTELLIRRVLTLLAHVDAPEEIVALTFTRKAAGEMRARVLQALQRAGDATAPADEHERETWQLARAVLERDAARGWSLASQPSRLRIQTLDSLCASLVQRLPLLSRLGAVPAIEDDAAELYHEAARATLGLLETGTPAQSTAVGEVLLHLDNRSGAVEELLVQMLGRRDQWLRHVVRHDRDTDRAPLEASLQAIRRDAFARATTLLAPLAERVAQLAGWAAGNLDADSGSALAACRGLVSLPTADEPGATQWLGLAELLLTAKGEWRKTVTAAVGFPAPSGERDPARKQRYKESKDEFAALVQDAACVDGLAQALAALTALPPARYDDAQWEVLGAAVEVLRLAAAQLDVVFAARGACDFIALAQAALQALGTADAPTDLLLALDARIRHLLVDEFQDTSVTQFELLARLTAGWSEGDGRTLFLVGDPMQSIYRFREADVGLFLRARHAGVQGLPLTSLRLSTNFRSAQGIVDWVNAAFAQLLPAQEDSVRGAVPFESATHWHGPGPAPAVSVHAFVDADDGAEAERVAAIVTAARRDDPQATVAVLVRVRAHLARIVPALRAAGVALRAVEIEKLRERPIVLDLLALTRALRHPADRIAWLAVLRAPWCGLALADLHALAAAHPRRPLWALITDAATIALLSDEGGARLAATAEALAPAIADARRGSLRDAVEGAWLRLGGADCLRAPRDLDDARAYLDLLAEAESAGDLPDLAALDARMEKLFAAPDPVDVDAVPVELMTIHKAKGLEFDVVFVPGLHRRPRTGEAPLLALAELPRAAGPDLLLGVVGATGDDGDRVHAWIGALERERERLEAARLLYVAATRARKQLHLLGIATAFDGKYGRAVRAAAKDTLLAPLWSVVQPQFEAALAGSAASQHPAAVETGDAAQPDPRTWRLPRPAVLRADDPRVPTLDWQVPTIVVGERPLPEFSWAGETVRLVGTVVHRWLQRIAQDGAVGWTEQRIDAMAEGIGRDLAAAGVPPSESAAAATRALAALKKTVVDERGLWLLCARPAADRAASELKLTGLDGRRRVDVAIDRTFIDGGVRWVIDYKTGWHEGAGREVFLNNEVERYREQLARYARMVATLGPEPVRCGLYFPLMSAWREWEG